MPIYEFNCPSCNEVNTKLCKVGEKGQELTCSNCGKIGLERKISTFSSPGVNGGNGSSCSPGCGGSCSSCH